MRLIQEEYSEGWQVLVACSLLNKTLGRSAAPVLEAIFSRWASPGELSAADPQELFKLVAPLGLKGTKGCVEQIHKLSQALTVSPSSNNLDQVIELAGGEYARESWQMLVLGRRDFWPHDQMLCLRMIELRLDFKVLRDFNSHIFLQLLRDENYVYAIGSVAKNGRDLLKIPKSEFHHLRTVNHEPAKLAETWLKSQEFIPLSDRAREILMKAISFDLEAKKVIGIHDTREEAPTEESITTIASESELSGFTLPVLATIYNIVTGKEIKSFNDRKSATRRTAEALEKLGNPEEPAAPKAVWEHKSHKYADDYVITLLVATNPKRLSTESGRRFALYQSGMTVKQALEAGIQRGDLSWDTKHGFVAITPADEAPEAVAPAQPALTEGTDAE